MTQDNTKLPLYKVLNEKRTQVEFNAHLYNLSDHTIREGKKGRVLMEVCKQHTNDPEAEANAQYTALCVNNLHHLAEALQGFVDYLDSDLSEAETILLNRAKEALKRIS